MGAVQRRRAGANAGLLGELAPHRQNKQEDRAAASAARAARTREMADAGYSVRDIADELGEQLTAAA